MHSENKRRRSFVAILLSSDGTALAVGGPNEDSAARGIGGEQGNDADAIDAGAVYLY